MVTGNLKSQIDELWKEFWTGGVTNPLTVIEQISYLVFSRMLDMRESAAERKFSRTKKGQTFPGHFFSADQQHLRWSHFKQLGGEEMLTVVRDEVFRHFRTLDSGASRGSVFSEYMKDATLMIQKASLLVSAVNMIDALPLERGDTKGDLYEYLLSKLTTAGIAGQFRTPRHIIDLMVDLSIEGQAEEAAAWNVADPACGTAGFLVRFLEGIRRQFTSEEGKLVSDEDGSVTYTGDLLTPEQQQHIQGAMLTGFDFDVTMLRIGAMNLMLHGVDAPAVHYQDTLGNSFPENFSELATDRFDLILANPPFKGALDYSDVHGSLTGKVKTKKTELLFLVLMLRMLRQGGRCAVVVPDGVLFGSSKAHKGLRKMLIEQHQLEAVVSLPSGVFKPYAGVSTAILFFTKEGETGDVWFYDVEHDGYSLDDKRNPVADDDLPDVRKRWAERDAQKDTDRKAKAFFVPKSEIAENDYDLSLSRYKEIVHEEIEYDPPQVILQRLAKIEEEIAQGRKELEGMLG